MKIETAEVRKVLSILDDIVKEYKDESPAKKRNWRTYEQQITGRLQKAFTELKPLVAEAVRSIKIIKGETRGTKSVLSLEQKVLILLLKHLFGKSNRNMAGMMVIFSWLTNVSVSYKTVERLYSDSEVIFALHNLHMLILKNRGIEEADCCGDSTGYSLTVTKHYATEAQKLKDKMKENSGDCAGKYSHGQYVYSFALMDINTRMYLGLGTSFTSEKQAYFQAMIMAKETGIKISSLRFDRYYSAKSTVEFSEECFGKVKMYLIPKSNVTVKGPWQWKRMLHGFVHDTKGHIQEYYKRNQSESGISEDKKRIGWCLGQKRIDRVDTANMLTGLWHNIYWLV